MKFRKSLLAILFTFTSVLNIANANLTEPVKLLHAQIDQGCTSCASLNGKILLQNISYVKHVDVVFQTSSDTEWYTIPADFSSMDEKNNEEIWIFKSRSLSSLLTGKTQFAIRYEVDGKTFWDNNCNQNYTLDARNHTTSETTGRSCQ
jgi:hypothetical protein